MKSRFLCIALYALLIGGLISCSSGDSNAVSTPVADGSGGSSFEYDGLENRLSIALAIQEALVEPERIFEFLAFIIEALGTAQTSGSPLPSCDSGTLVDDDVFPLPANTTVNYDIDFTNCYIGSNIIDGEMDFTFLAGTDPSERIFQGNVAFNNLRILDNALTVNSTISFEVDYANDDKLESFRVTGGTLNVVFGTISPFEETASTYTFTTTATLTDSVDYRIGTDALNGNQPVRLLTLDYIVDSEALGKLLTVTTEDDIFADENNFPKDGSILVETTPDSEVRISADLSGSKTFDVSAVNSSLESVAVDASTWHDIMANPTTDFIIPNGDTSP